MTKTITENSLKPLSTSESFARGRELYLSGAVFDTFRQGNLLIGRCTGSSASFYHLSVQLDEGGILDASCTCPYDWGGYCKHIIALLLTYIHDPEVFIEQKKINEMLKDLDKDALLNLIANMVDEYPYLYPWLQTTIPIASRVSDAHPLPEKQRTQFLRTEYRKQIHSILHSLNGYRMSEAYWMMGGMVDQLNHIYNTAYEFLMAGEAQRALAILTTLLTEVGGSFDQFDDSDGELGYFFSELALPLTEAILSADLDETERRNLSKELKPVIDELSVYGIDDLDVILAALNRGWSDEMLDELEDYDFDVATLIEAKLNILERQNQVKEFLNLCLETGEYQRYILKQIEEGKFEEALDVAWKTLNRASDALRIASALREAGRLSDAICLAEKGLSLEGSKYELGKWLGPIEETQGRTEQAIQAYQAAFASLPSLELYNMLKELSGQNWYLLKPVLMQVIQSISHAGVLVDVYLSEEEWDAAIAIADSVGDWQYALIEKVADAVLPFRPNWVIQVSQKQAEGLIARTNSKYYVIAVHWLQKMKQAYLSTGRKIEWLTYLERLKSTYSRRPALQAELRVL